MGKTLKEIDWAKLAATVDPLKRPNKYASRISRAKKKAVESKNARFSRARS